MDRHGDGIEDIDAPDGPSGATASAPAQRFMRRVVALKGLTHGTNFGIWCQVAEMKLKASRTDDETQKAAVYEALMDVPIPYAAAEPLLQEPTKTAQQVLQELARGSLSDWIHRKREPKWTKWSPEYATLRAHIGALKNEAQDSGCNDSQLRSGFMLTISGLSQSIASERLALEPNISSTDLMDGVLDAVENDVTETDLDLLESTVQEAGETTDTCASRVYNKTLKVLSAQQQGKVTVDDVKKKARRVFVRALKPPIGPRVRAVFPDTWEKAVTIARQVENEVGVVQEAKIGVIGSGRGRGRGAWRGRGGTTRGGGTYRGGGAGGRGGARSNNSSSSSSSFNASNVACHACRQTGHLVKNCPNHVRKCYICDGTDHLAAQCPNNPNKNAPGGGVAQNQGAAAAAPQ